MVIGVVMACVGGRGCGGAVAFVGGRWTVCSSGSIRAGPVITGTDGLLPALLKEALERGLAAELTDHLELWEEPGRLRRRVPTRGSGSAAKTVDSEVGPFETGGPPAGRARSPRAWCARDSAGPGGLDSMIISLYARA